MKISSFNIFDRELEKYLFIKFVKNFIFFISISLLIVFLVEFVELLRRTSENPNISSIFYVLYLAFLKITESIAFIIPISIFGTTMITCRAFNKSREMVIIQNTGLHSFRILYPFIVFTLLFCAIYFTILNPFFSKRSSQIFLKQKFSIGKTELCPTDFVGLLCNPTQIQCIVRYLSLLAQLLCPVRILSDYIMISIHVLDQICP